MKKILLLAPFDIFPPVHGGSAHVHRTLRNLVRENRIAVLITHHHSKNGKINIDHPNVSIHYCSSSFIDKFTVFSVLLNPLYFYSAWKIARKFKPDIVQCEILWTVFAGILLRRVLGRPLIYVAHNVENLKYKEIGASILLQKIIFRVENIAVKKADMVLCLSDIDRSHLIRQFPVDQRKIRTVPPYLDTNEFNGNKCKQNDFKEFGIKPGEIIISFLGNLSYVPNIEAVKHISEIIYEEITESFRNVRFLIMGQNEQNVLRYKKEKMVFAGYVSHEVLMCLINRSDIMLVPITQGSGVRIKLLEAAACSKAIISTIKGAEGLGFENMKDILITENVNRSFIEGIKKLINEPDLRRNIGQNARKKVEKIYSWQRGLQAYREIYDSLQY